MEIYASCPAEAWINSSKLLLGSGVATGDIDELLGVKVTIQSNEFDPHFDKLFRSVFGDERIDTASKVLFQRPTKKVLLKDTMKYIKSDGDWKNSYWNRLVAYNGHYNQIEEVIKLLKKHISVKRCTTVLVHPEADKDTLMGAHAVVYAPENDQRLMVGQPCLISLDFKPRNGKIHTFALFRSQRISKSGYADFSALSDLTSFLAEESDLEFGTLTTFACSFHTKNSGPERKNTLKLLKLLGNREDK